MGIGFTSDHDDDVLASDSQVVSPKYGLSVQQMHVLGLTPEGMTKVKPVDEADIRAKAFYVGDAVTTTTRQATRMGPVDTKAPGQAPPDLPSLLLDSNIVVIGTSSTRERCLIAPSLTCLAFVSFCKGCRSFRV
jgi:hypothetical protein